LNRTGISQLSNSPNAYKKGKFSTTERVNHLFQLSAEMDAHDLANDGDDEVQPEDAVVPETAPIDLGGGISYPNPCGTTNDADIDVFGVNDNGKSDSNSDDEEYDNDDDVDVGDGQDSLRKALACYDAVRIAHGRRIISNYGGVNVFHVYHKKITKSLSLGQSKFKLFLCGLGLCQILSNLFLFLSTF
jgi:hypothetical protein